jgi:type IV secretory pathway ATPase VirB11/archaellum biosynthesis ATPase
VSYTGSVTVGHAAPTTPAAASMKDAATRLTDSIGAAVAVSLNP